MAPYDVASSVHQRPYFGGALDWPPAREAPATPGGLPGIERLSQRAAQLSAEVGTQSDHI